ncbi:MAG: pyruvate kinase [Pirellulales bacterium]
MDSTIRPQAFKDRARTKIVATVGPACDSLEMLAELVAAGADVFRLNMAHSDLETHAAVVKRIRQISRQSGQPVAILVDLAGPKIRLGELPEGEVQCAIGDVLWFVRGEPHSASELTSTYEALVDELAVGDPVILADGSMSMEVINKQDDRVECRVTQGGKIRSRQGINLPGVKLSAPALGEEDRRHARWAAEQEADFVSLSFVRSPEDVRELSELLRDAGSAARVIAKIEKREALDQLEAIVETADGVMVARGDLGVETDVARMPVEQKRIVEVCRQYQRPVIIATQMLESMHHSPRPTRAEATDVANAVLDGGDACMLSGETAIGEYPREAVAMMNRIALATEQSREGDAPLPTPEQSAKGLHEVTRAVVLGAGRIAHELEAKLVVVASHSGATALALSGQRNFIPTIGLSDSPVTRRQMCLSWGVIPLAIDAPPDVGELIRVAEHWGRSAGGLADGDRMVLVCGSIVAVGVHDVVVVHTVGDDSDADAMSGA